MKETNLCDRLAEKSSAKIEVLIEPEIKKTFIKIVASEGTTASAELGHWIRKHIKETTNNTGDQK